MNWTPVLIFKVNFFTWAPSAIHLFSAVKQVDKLPEEKCFCWMSAVSQKQRMCCRSSLAIKCVTVSYWTFQDLTEWILERWMCYRNTMLHFSNMFIEIELIQGTDCMDFDSHELICKKKAIHFSPAPFPHNFNNSQVN